MLVLICLGVAAGVIDSRERIIPNWICIAIMLIGLILQLMRLSVWFNPAIFNLLSVLPLTYHMATALPSAISCVLAAVVIIALGTFAEFLQRKITLKAGMGMGDIKYIGAWAMTLGWLVVPALALACLFGACYALCAKQKTFALGPWLSFAFITTLLMILFFPVAQMLIV